MALERLLGATALATVDTEEAIGGVAKQLGWNFATNLTGKAVKKGYVRMTSAGSFVSGTKWQLWERATPISSSIRRLNIELGGITGASGDEIEVPAFTAWPIAQNAAHMVSIFHPSTQTGNNWYEAGFGARTVPPNTSLSGNCIYHDTATTVDTPPEFEGFTDGGFAVDVGIDDAVSDITATLGIVLPVPAWDSNVDLIGSANLSIILPVPTVALSGDLDIAASLGIVLPVPTVDLTMDADIAASLGIVLPVPAVSLDADADIAASLAITLPVPAVDLSADADISTSLAIVLPAPAVALEADEDITATLGITLPVPQVSLNAGSVLPDITATLDIALPVPTISLTAGDDFEAENLREYVWNLVSADAGMNGLNIGADSLFAMSAPDSPAATLQVWAVLNWGIEEPPLGRDTTTRRRFVSVWAYDRQRRYDRIEAILGRVRDLLYPLKAVNYAAGGWITEVTDNGTSEDLWDPAYNAATKNWQLTIVSSGT